MTQSRTELHRHLDVSTRLSTLLELAQAQGFESKSTSLEAFGDKVILRKPTRDLREALAHFQIFQKVLDRPETLERIAFETIEDCYLDGTRAVELRFSPEFACEWSKLSWNDVLSGFEAGIRRALVQYPAMKAGLILIAVRDYGVESIEKTVEFFLKNRSRFIGLDLAGNEEEHPCRLFEEPFQQAKRAGARITIHSGEGAGPENVWEAIDRLGAERIGHGVRSIQDPLLIDHLVKSKICLEICPTSNVITRAVSSLEAHPLARLLRAGVPVTLNTDDPTVFGVQLSDEIRLAHEKLGLSASEIDLCFENATRHSFL